jgi:hypothetical protein
MKIKDWRIEVRIRYFLLPVVCLFLACNGKDSNPPPTTYYIKSVEVKNKQTGEIKVDNFERFIDIEIDKDERKDDVIVKLVLADGVSMVSPATTEAEYNLEEAVYIRLSAGNRVVSFKMSARDYDPDTDTEFIKSVEVKNKRTGEITIDNLARTIDIEIDKNESKHNVIVSLVLAEGVSMVSPATTEAEYNLEEPVNIRLSVGGREVNFSMSAKDYDPGTDYPDFFPGEIKPAPSIACFQGAYYRKAVSSRDKWRGISVKVVLPQIYYDLDRPNPARPGQYLDNFSLYLGGNAGGQESDIGLTWEVIRNAQGQVTAERVCFRPFWRYTAHGDQPSNGWDNADAQNTNYHYYPGDTLYMSLKLVADKRLRFEIEGSGRISHKKFSVEFPCNGYTLTANTEYKRVNAIDQTGNEGKPVQPTKAKTEGTEWLETNLLRLEGTETVTVPMHSGRYTDMRCPTVQNIQVIASEGDMKKGAEKVNRYGTPGSKPTIPF